MTRPITTLLTCALLIICSAPLRAVDEPAPATTVPATAPAPSLLSNGDFETAKGDGPADWGVGKGVSWEVEGDNRFLRLQSPQPGAQVTAYRAVPVPSGVGAMQFSYKVRYEGIKRGGKQWFDGRIMMNFKDAKGETVKPGPGDPNFNGTSKGWVERAKQFRVPPGAVTLEMIFTLFNAEAGRLDFDDVRLAAFPVATLEAMEAEARAKEAARIAKLPKPKPQVPVPPPDKLPKELRVVGNTIRNAAGEQVWLQGVAIPSLEWSAGGEQILKSIEVAIRDWKSNCIRIPLREHFWSGTGPWQNDGGMKYRQLVDDAVNLCATHGVYVVLDLHAFHAPQKKHVDFWTDLAPRYKDHPAVLYELYNEPVAIPWEVWRNGGHVIDAKPGQRTTEFDSPGIQALLDAVRATGAKNIVIAGGLDWGYDLSGVLNGFALKEHEGGNGIVYSSHVYPWKSNWQEKFLAVAEKHPLFLGEVGAEQELMPFLQSQEDPHTWVPDMLGVIQKHKLHWTAWNFHPKSRPRVILDWDYTPTPFWGAYVKRALAGEQFEMKKMR